MRNALLLVLAAATVASALSIETGPVKVTHRNSGPRYDIDELERARQLVREPSAAGAQRDDVPPPSPAQQQQPPPPQPAEGPQEGAAEEVPAVGHVAIRRVFLFPVMRPSSADNDWSREDSSEPQQPSGRREQEGAVEPRMPMIFAKPFWPFMTPARPSPGHAPQSPAQQADEHDERSHIIRHLFGADEASRSPSNNNNNNDGDQDKAASGGGQPDRDQAMAGPQQQRPVFDPIQMMLDMMHQAISGQLGPNFSRDLNSSSSSSNDGKSDKEAASSNDNSAAESSDERPAVPAAGRFGAEQPGLFAGLRPGAQNETREDVVEIDGKKYLRKTVVSKHVGDNIVFMTRRLIFVPLNETAEPSTPADTATTTTTAASTSARPAPGGESEEVPSLSAVHRVGSNKPTTFEPELPSSTTTSTTPTTTTTTTTEQPATSKEEEETTPQPSARPAEAPTSSSEPKAADEMPTVPKSAERLVEANGGESSSPRPAAGAAVTPAAAA